MRCSVTEPSNGSRADLFFSFDVKHFDALFPAVRNALFPSVMAARVLWMIFVAKHCKYGGKAASSGKDKGKFREVLEGKGFPESRIVPAAGSSDFR